MDWCVSQDRYGNVFVDFEDGTAASRINGIWINKIMFDMYQMRDELIIQEGPAAKALLKDAINYLQDHKDTNWNPNNYRKLRK